MIQIINTTYYRINSGKSIKTRIALVADLHNNDGTPVIDILKKEKPDIIAVAGDLMTMPDYDTRRKEISVRRRILCFIYGTIKKALSPFERENCINHDNAFDFLTRAVKLAPVYYAFGNHERGITDEVKARIRATGAVLLEDLWIKVNGIELGGIVSRKHDELRLDRIGKSDAYRVLLCHNPEHAECVSAAGDMDLILSGHAHGGQIKIGSRGLFAPGQGLFPRLTGGVYRVNDATLIVSRGLANTVPLIPRIGNKKEVVIIDIVD